MPLWGSFALIGLGILGIFVEVFVPAAGIIGIAGGGSIIAAVVLAYANHSGLEATLVLATAVVATPAALILGFKVFPKSPIGKQLILQDRQDNPGQPAQPRTLGANEDLIGAEGESLTTLRPSGTARIEGRRLSVVTTGEYIQRNERVRVISVEGSRVVVRQVRD